jgi:hypothetical protein
MLGWFAFEIRRDVAQAKRLAASCAADNEKLLALANDAWRRIAAEAEPSLARSFARGMLEGNGPSRGGQAQFWPPADDDAFLRSIGVQP